MPPRSAVLLLMMAACPISASVIVIAVFPSRASIFSGSAWDQLLLQLYFVSPALFAAIGSFAVRRFVARLTPEHLFTFGVFGFAAFGLADGLNNSSMAIAFAMRAGIGFSSALIMTGFNQLAMRRYDTNISTWLLTYLNLATSSYGLAVALLAGWLAELATWAPFLLFVTPALVLPRFFASFSLKSIVTHATAPATKPRPLDRDLPTVALAFIIFGHMAVHVLFYLSLAQSKPIISGYVLSNGELTAVYILGHVLGAILFKPVKQVSSTTKGHLMAALLASLVSAVGLAVSSDDILSVAFLLIAGLSLSHVLPLIFVSIRDSVPADSQGRYIADAVACGFLGQFGAPFLLQLARTLFGSDTTPATAATIVSALLVCVALSIRVESGAPRETNG